MAPAIAKNTTKTSNVFSLCEYRAADAATRQHFIKDQDQAFPARKYPSDGFRQISEDVATSAKMIRAGLLPTAGLASWLDRLSVSAEVASRNVREFESRALRAERQLKKAEVKTKRR